MPIEATLAPYGATKLLLLDFLNEIQKSFEYSLVLNIIDQYARFESLSVAFLWLWGNYAGGSGSGSTCSSSEVSVGLSTSTSLFSNLATKTAISLTVSNDWVMSSLDRC